MVIDILLVVAVQLTTLLELVQQDASPQAAAPVVAADRVVIDLMGK